MKTVAVVVSYFPTVSETFIVNQINGLIDAGYTVRLYAYNKVEAPLIHDSIRRHHLLQKVTYFTKSPVSKFSRPFALIKWTLQHFFSINWKVYARCLNVFRYGKAAYSLKLIFEAQWFLLPYDFELIHTHFGMTGNRIAYLKAQGILPEKIKLLNTFHGYDLLPNKPEAYRKDYRYLFQEASAFTVNTPYLEGLLQEINTGIKPCYILPVSLDTNFFKREATKKETAFFDLVFCGKLIPLKGPDLAIDIIKQLLDWGYPQVRLHIIGKGPLKVPLEARVQESKLGAHVIFYGAFSQSDFKQRLEQADAFLLAGRYDPETGRAETQGLVLQEAQAMELPVIVAEVGGMPYGLVPNQSGFVVAEGDVWGFAKAIEKLILDPELKVEMGQMGRQFSENYDTHLLALKLQDIYQNLHS